MAAGGFRFEVPSSARACFCRRETEEVRQQLFVEENQRSGESRGKFSGQKHAMIRHAPMKSYLKVTFLGKVKLLDMNKTASALAWFECFYIIDIMF